MVYQKIASSKMKHSQLSIFEIALNNLLPKVLANNIQYQSVVAEAHTPPYKIHKYFARRPHNVFADLIENFSNPNDTILDVFCGGGVTIYEGLRKNRKVIGCDLNPLSIFVVGNMVKKPQEMNQLQTVFLECTNYLKSLYDNYYDNIDWCELTFEAKCNLCSTITLLTNENRVKNGYYKCANLECLSHQNKNKGFATKDCTRIGHKYLFATNGGKNSRKTYKIENELAGKLDSHLVFLRDEIKNKNIEIPKDAIPKDWDRQFEDGLIQKNIIYFQDMFTERNLLINLLLLDFIKSFEGKISRYNYELLRITFSNTVKDTNIMSFTNDGWQSGKPTTWSKHAYWIPNQFCEVNILSIFENAIKKINASLLFNAKQKYNAKRASTIEELEENNFLLLNNSVANTSIPANSIDAIITDPPYGSNVQYLELSHFWYVWNKDMYNATPDFALEAVANRKKGFKGAKSMYDYENNLYKVFSKSFEVLKPEKYMVMTFNNKDVSAWLSLMFSVFKAGFTLEENGLYFQDGVENYKQTSHTKSEGSPYGDFIYVFKKAEKKSEIIYTSEKQFIQDLDSLFKSYLHQETEDRNTLIKEMFLNAIPLIECFSKTYLIENKHSLYSYFKKDYLENLY